MTRNELNNSYSNIIECSNIEERNKILERLYFDYVEKRIEDYAYTNNDCFGKSFVFYNNSSQYENVKM